MRKRKKQQKVHRNEARRNTELNELAIEIKNIRKSNSLRSKCEENYRKK